MHLRKGPPHAVLSLLLSSKTELKALMPEYAKEAIGHGIRAQRSKSGAISFETAVQRSSETIGTIAAALAKAQSELINPEPMQTF